MGRVSAPGVSSRTAIAGLRMLVVVAAAMFDSAGCEGDDADDHGAAGTASSGGAGSQTAAGSADRWQAGSGGTVGIGPVSVGGAAGSGQSTGVVIHSTPPPARVASPYVVESIALHACGRMLPSCGGDVVGTWNVVTYCQIGMLEAVESIWPTGCRDVLRSHDFTVAGTITFGSAGELDFGVDFGGTSRIVIDGSCGGALTRHSGFTQEICEQGIENQLVAHELYSDAECSFAIDECICETALTASVIHGSLYSLSNDELTVFSTVGSTVVPYCVDRDTLTLELTDELGATIELVLSRAGT
jgi:hypothetical protein